MPNKCSAPGCRSNYAGESYTPVFKLPTCPPDLVNQWLRALSREGIEDLKNIYVCAKHFLPEDIETNYSIPQLDGSVLEIQRTIPKLRKNAIPRVLPNCPSYFSSASHSKPQRLDRSARDRTWTFRLGLFVQVLCTDNYPINVIFFYHFRQRMPRTLLFPIQMIPTDLCFCYLILFILSSLCVTTG